MDRKDQKELDELKDELKILSRIFEDRVSKIQNRIEKLEKHAVEEVISPGVDEPVRVQKAEPPEKTLDSGRSAEQSDDRKETPAWKTAAERLKDTAIAAAAAGITVTAADAPKKVATEEYPPEKKFPQKEAPVAAMEKPKEKPAVKPRVDFLTKLTALPLPGPLADLTANLVELYKKFRNEGKLPVLFLTAAGILASVAGVGFLLQYSFVNFFGPAAKIISGAALALGLVILGARIIARNIAYREFGSSIIGLGVIINFLCIYFAALYYHLIPLWAGFILIAGNTFAAYLLALRYETKVVSLVTFLGGAFVPFFLGISGTLNLFYLVFLVFLCVSALHLSMRIKWEAMVYLSFVTAAGIMEWSLFTVEGRGEVWLFALLFHFFAYIYAWYSFFEGKRYRENPGVYHILVLTGAVILLLVNLYTLFDGSPAAGYLFLGNGILFLVPALLPRWEAASRKPRAVHIIFGGIFFLLAVPILFHFDFMMLLWAPEALALLYLGFIYELKGVRKEGYIVGAVALVQAFLIFPRFADHWGKTLVNTGMMNLLVLGVFLAGGWLILLRFKKDLLEYEKKIQYGIREALAPWSLLVLLLPAFFWFPQYALVLVMFPMAWYLVRGQRHELPFTRFFGYFSFALLMCELFYLIILAVDRIELIFRMPPLEVVQNESVVHLAFLGLILAAAWRLLQQVNVMVEKPEKQLRRFTGEMISAWLFAVIILASVYIVPAYPLVLVIGAIFLLFRRSSKLELKITEWLAYGAYILVLGQASYSAGIVIMTAVSGADISLGEVFSHQAFYHLLGSGALLLVLNLMLPEITKRYEKPVTGLSVFNNELVSTWALGAFLVVMYLLVPGYALSLAILPMPFLLIRGTKKKLPFTTILGLSCYLLIILQAVIVMKNSGTVHFSELPLNGKVALIESIALMWFMQLFFEKVIPGHPLVEFFKKLRVSFYLLLPVMFLPTVRRRAFEYLSLAMWGSVIINFLLYEKLKLEILFKELYAVLAAAAAAALLMSLFPVSETSIVLRLAAPGVGIFLMGIFIYLKGLKAQESSDKNPWFALLTGALLYIALALGTITYVLTGVGFAAWHVIASVFLLYALLIGKNNSNAVYAVTSERIGQVLVALITVTGISAMVNATGSLTWFHVAFQILSLGMLALVTFTGLVPSTDRDGKEEEGAREPVIDHYLFHLVAVAIYVMTIRMITGDWSGPGITIALVLHMVAVMSYATIGNMKKLVPLYASGLGIAALKIFFYDLKDFSLVEKIIAFTVMGIVMLGAAFFLQRLQRE